MTSWVWDAPYPAAILFCLVGLVLWEPSELKGKSCPSSFQPKGDFTFNLINGSAALDQRPLFRGSGASECSHANAHTCSHRSLRFSWRFKTSTAALFINSRFSFNAIFLLEWGEGAGAYPRCLQAKQVYPQWVILGGFVICWRVPWQCSEGILSSSQLCLHQGLVPCSANHPNYKICLSVI